MKDKIGGPKNKTKRGLPKAESTKNRTLPRTNDQMEGYSVEEEELETELLKQQYLRAKEAAEKSSAAIPADARGELRVPFDFLDEIFYVDARGRRIYLDERNKILVCEYMANGFDRKKAMLAAGYPEKSARTNQGVTFRKPLVQRALRLAMRYRLQKLDVSTERIMDEYTSMGFSNIMDVCEVKNGRLVIKDTADIPHRARKAIMEITETTNNQGTTLKVRMHDKKGSLDSMMRHMGGFREQVDLNINTNAADILKAARDRLIEAKRVKKEDLPTTEYSRIRDTDDEVEAGGGTDE